LFKRALRRGVTLIEILIVLAIIGLIAGGVAIVAVPKYQAAQVSATKIDAAKIHQIAEMWRAGHASECPTAERLKAEKEIGATSKITDAWDTPFEIICAEDGITVVSLGPDKKKGTKDDIRVGDNAEGGK
jgi:general secretion pathway protein G